MHYAEFAEDEVEASPGADTLHVANPMRGTLQSVALREAIKEYDANKWKVIGQKVGKPAKVSYTIYHIYLGLVSFLYRPCAKSTVRHRHANNTQKSISKISKAWQAPRETATHQRIVCPNSLFSCRLLSLVCFVSNTPGSRFDCSCAFGTS